MRADDNVTQLCYYISVANIEIVEYIDEAGRNYYAEWFAGLDSQAAQKVFTYVSRMEAGNFSNAKGVEKRRGLLELVINYSKGYRVYFSRDGDHLVLLFGGGTKQRQNRDITRAEALLQEYKRRKKK